MTQYQSIYRKWRPRFFEDIVGQKHITRTLMNAIKLNRIAHAYIFSGPRGVGKTSTARILAKALNCQEGPTDHPCNQCNQCIRINNGQSMDVVEIDGASNRGIDEIRELRSKIGFAPAEGKYKVYIIDEVHMLTNEAFNALLKTLEEPPSQVLFIFATTAPHKVPNTILSRCQCFNFRRISIDEMVEKLKKIIEEDNLNIDLPSLRLIAESATGSMRDAESILDQVISFSENKVTYEDVKELLGIIPQKLFLQLTRAIANQDTKEGLELIEKLVREGVDLHQFVQDMVVYIHKLSLIKILGNNSHYSSMPEEENSDQLLELATAIDMKIMVDTIEELNKIEDKIKYHHYPWILLELVVVKMTQDKNENQKEESADKPIVNKKETAEKKSEESFHKENKKKEAQSFKKTNKYHNNDQGECQFNEIWPKVLSRVKNERISLHAFLTANSEAYIEGNQLMIGFHRDCLFHKESLEKKENREKVEAILSEEAKFKIKMNCFITENNNNAGFTHFDLEENKGKIENKDAVNHEYVNPGASEGNLEQIKKGHSSDNSILEEARDLFGGKIIED